MKLEVLIVVKTYPQPARKGIEVSCIQGVTHNGEWVRLFPVPFRFLHGRQQFKRYQWIRVDAKKAKDTRPESFSINPDTIEILSDPLPTTNKWEARKKILAPLVSPSIETLENEREIKGTSLGLIKPKKISRLILKPTLDDWTETQKAKLSQMDMFHKRPRRPLEKVPFDFRYAFQCDDKSCRGRHVMKINDWEVYQAYRSWRNKYGGNWEDKFRLRFETEMIDKNDTHLFVGTLFTHPHRWTITGLLYPPK